jgi:hypothetical protein
MPWHLVVIGLAAGPVSGGEARRKRLNGKLRIKRRRNKCPKKKNKVDKSKGKQLSRREFLKDARVWLQVVPL